MRVLVELSGFGPYNHGDTAMTCVGLQRLLRYLPYAGFFVVNSHCAELLPGIPVVQVDPEDRMGFFRNVLPGNLLRRLVGKRWAESLLRRERKLLVTKPELWNQLLSLRQRVRTSGEGNPGRFLSVLKNADVLVVTGGGMLNDSFHVHALSLLEEMDLFLRSGRKVYLFGQGIGPMERPDLRARAREVLPRVTRILVREARLSPALLAELGVSRERVVVTGDDAIGMARSLAPPRLNSDLGVNLRLAYYSELDTREADAIGEAIRGASADIGARLRVVPISRFTDADDLRDTWQHVLGAEPPPEALPLETVADVIAAAGKCRVVVTGSYHAAVFALSQGVSAVCLVRSAYYASKFLGLQEQFGRGCEVFFWENEGAGMSSAERLRATIRKTWDEAPEVRSALLKAAERQVEAGEAAYREMSMEFPEAMQANPVADLYAE